MATYKVIQDIEAEDKLIGPLTLRQFIYAAIAALCGYFIFLSFSKHIPLLAVVFAPIFLAAGFFAFPWGRDQPTEVWALAKVRFAFKPHRRIWNQSGIKQLVTITAPRRPTQNYTDGLSREEVQSRLKALAATIDTRGWATKNVNVNLYSVPIVNPTTTTTDRLVNATSLPQSVSDIDIQASDDMLDEQNNPTAQHFDQMIASSTKEHRKQLMQEVQDARAGKQPQTTQQPSVPTQTQDKNAPPDFWFLNQGPAPDKPLPKGYTTFDTRVVAPGVDDMNTPQAQPGAINETMAEQELSEELKAKQRTWEDTYHSHLKVIKPPGTGDRAEPEEAETEPTEPEPSAPAQHNANTMIKSPGSIDILGNSAPEPAPQAVPMPPPPPVTPTPDPAILALASNNDLNVATIARQANQATKKQPPEDEVVINLH